MMKSKGIQQALKLTMALFVSAPAVGQEAQIGVRASDPGKRATGIRTNKRDASINTVGGGGDPRIGDLRVRKLRRLSPESEAKRRVDGVVEPSEMNSGILMK